uniref:Si:ch73-233k15.2 n=1 Tax=Oryzias latipes TaxID=8090 RepID=A0A3P9J0M6_ORYLA
MKDGIFTLYFLTQGNILFYRKELEDALRCYVTDILTDIQTVRDFCEKFSKWMLWRETELERIRDIKKRADDVNRQTRQPRMLQFLNELEENAVQLDRMSKGAKISSVAGSSVGAVGGVLSIVGLALIPVTAGVSLALTMAGVGMGVTSGVNSLVTTATDKQAISQLEAGSIELAVGVGKLAFKAGGVCKSIDGIVDLASIAKLLKSEELVSSASKAVVQEAGALRSVSKVASDVPDIGQAAVKSSLVLSQSARAGLIAVNALFLGLDVFFICKDSISLAKGSETEVLMLIRRHCLSSCSFLPETVQGCVVYGARTALQ